MRLAAAAAGIGISCVAAAEKTQIRIHGEGWAEAGRMMHVTDTLVVNLNGNWMQSSGAQFTAIASIGDNWEGAFGFGGYQIYHSLGGTVEARSARSAFQNFITEARMTYFLDNRVSPWFSLTFGNFAYNYNPSVKNLGMYLLRGPVYPGYLMSGFKDFRIDTTKGNVLGLHVHHAMGNFSHDLILANERELPPTFDWSLAYVAKYRAFGALEIGAGVNFYRLIAANKDLTDPSPAFYGYKDSVLLNDGKAHRPYEFQYITVGPGGDTTRYTLRGTKLMAMFDLDFKPLFGIRSMGSQDLKLYGEAAVLGVKDYGSVYNDIFQRIPATLGFNVPTFGLLDYLSLEVEWYGAKYRNDLSKIGNFNTLPGITHPNPDDPAQRGPSPIPTSYATYGIDADGNYITAAGDTLNVKGTALDMENLTADNWKWSIAFEKTIEENVRFSGQIANDHFRPRPTATDINEHGGMAEAFSSLKDWYVMFRLGYFF